MHIIIGNRTTPKLHVIARTIDHAIIQSYKNRVHVFLVKSPRWLMVVTTTRSMCRLGRNWIGMLYFRFQNTLEGADWSRYLIAVSVTAVVLNKIFPVAPFYSCLWWSVWCLCAPYWVAITWGLRSWLNCGPKPWTSQYFVSFGSQPDQFIADIVKRTIVRLWTFHVYTAEGRLQTTA